MDDERAARPHFLPLRRVAAVGVGNALDFYDFLTYSFFAVQIGHCFFPGGTAAHGLLLSLATFGVGFMMRPLGGVLIGLYADRAGRRPAMLLSFSLMGAGVIGLALTPSYARIGVAAPVLLVLFRLVQGFALGGEVGPSTAFLVEAAPPLRRGLYVSLQYATQDFAVLVAGVVGFALANLLSPAQLDAWGWRLAFGLGATIVPFGLAMRRLLPETLEARHGGRAASRRLPWGLPWGLVVPGLMLAGCGTIVGYGFDYMTTYVQDSLHMPANLAFGATVALGVMLVSSDIAAGVLSDRFGRKPVMLIAAVALLVLVVPLYMLMIRWPDAAVVYAVTGVLGVLEGFLTGPALVALTEMLPKSARSVGLGTIYSVAVAALGGTTQFMMKWFGDVSGSKLAPACYVAAALVMGIAAMLVIRETAPARTGAEHG
jgi:MFS family permease